MQHKSAQFWIEHYRMQPHPEGGYYAEIHRSKDEVLVNNISYSAGTVIYFLLEAHQFSALHTIKSDESWHFLAGNPISVHEISPLGIYNKTILGDPNNPMLQYVVKAGNWFGATVEKGYALVGCTVFPGFEFKDFRLAQYDQIIQLFPQHRAVIAKLTHHD